MSRIEVISRENWGEFLAAPAALLMLGKSDCKACAQWTEELNAFLESDTQWTRVRFGKLELDKGGMGEFKKENTWISELDALPYNIIYTNGERAKEWLGSGVDRLVNRLQRVASA